MTDIVVHQHLPLACRNGIAMFMANIDIKDSDDPYDGPALAFCRKTFGFGRTAFFRLQDLWHVREPDLIERHAKNIATQLFVSPSITDEHVVRTMLEDFADDLCKQPDLDTEAQDRKNMMEAADKSGLVIAVNGETLVDAR